MRPVALFFFLIISTFFFLVSLPAGAQGLPSFGALGSRLNKVSFPVGGMVLSGGGAGKALITCSAAYGPIFNIPYVIAPPGPYFIKSGDAGAPRAGGYILGNYSLIPDLGTCVQTQTGIPIPAFELKPYGVSR